MSNFTLAGLPPALYAFAVFFAPVVSAVLGNFSTLIAKIPGLRPSDDSRTILMRVVVGIINGAGILVFAWMQSIVLDKTMIVAFVLTALGQTALAHYTYVGIKNGPSGNSSTSNTDPAAVAQAASDALAAAQNAAK